MKTLLRAALLSLALLSAASAQVTGVFEPGGDLSGKWNNQTIVSGAVTLSKMANESASTILCNNTGSPAAPIACTPSQLKTLLAIANTDVSGLGSLATLSALPNPSASTLGGIESLAAVSHNWLNAISTSGVPSATQPACGDLSNAAASCSTDATNASNIGSGTLGAARMPLGITATPTAGQLLLGNAGGTAYAANTMSGDGTLSSAGALNVSKFNGGTTFGTLAGQSGTFSGASSGTNTGDQTITLTGDTTGSGTGSFITTTKQIHDNLKSVNNAASPYTVLAADSFIYVDATAGAVVITLPAATGTGREISVKKIDSTANAVTVTAAGANLIDGAATVAITSQYSASKIIDSASAVWSRSHVNQLAGDVTGTSSNNTVSKIRGVTIGGNVPYIFSQSGIPIGFPPSGYMTATGVYVIGKTPASNATALFSATSGAGVTVTFSAGTPLTGTASDVGRVITILDTTYKYFTITTGTSSVLATGTISGGTLSGLTMANANLWISGTQLITNTAGADATLYPAPLAKVYANLYLYFAAASPIGSAGVYFAQMVSSTVGTVYNNALTSGAPTIPGSPTAFSGLTPAFFTQDSNAYKTVLTISLPGNSLGASGQVDVDIVLSSNNSAGSKVVQPFYNAQGMGTPGATIGMLSRFFIKFWNRGVTNSQTSSYGSAVGGLQTVSSTLGTTDSTAAQNITLSEYIAVPTDQVVLENYKFIVSPSN